MAKKVKLSEEAIKRFFVGFFIVVIAVLVLSYYLWGPAALIGAVIMSIGTFFFIVYVGFRGL